MTEGNTVKIQRVLYHLEVLLMLTLRPDKPSPKSFNNAEVPTSNVFINENIIYAVRYGEKECMFCSMRKTSHIFIAYMRSHSWYIHRHHRLNGLLLYCDNIRSWAVTYRSSACATASQAGKTTFLCVAVVRGTLASCTVHLFSTVGQNNSSTLFHLFSFLSFHAFLRHCRKNSPI